MTPNDILAIARHLINDTDASGYRQSNAELLRYLTGGLALVYAARPEFFRETKTVTCLAGVIQSLSLNECQAIVNVERIHNGPALTLFDAKTLDQFSPAWRNGTPAAAKQWSPHGDEAAAFLLYPPSNAGQKIDVLCLKKAPVLTEDDLEEVLSVPDWMLEPLASYVAGRSELKDDEHVESGRAVALNNQFTDAIKAGRE